MHVVHCIATLGSGGAETLVRDLSIELVGRGCRVSVVALSAVSALGGSVEFENRFREQATAGGVELYEIGHFARKFPPYGAFRFRKLMKQLAPDLVHHHLQWTLLFNQLSRVSTPCVYTHHSDRFGRSEKMFRKLAKISRTIVGISPAIGERIASMNVQKTITIPNAINNRFLPVNANERQADGKSKKIKVISVGRINTPKNYSLLLEIASRIKNSESKFDIEFQIVGGGPELSELENLVEERKLGDFVKLLGTRSDVPELLHQSNIYLLTSAWEGLPISLIEAAMAGLPIVSTNVGSCDEAVKNGVNGYIHELDDIDGMVQSVTKLAEDAKLRKTLSENSRTVGAGFEIEESANRHLQLYRSVLETA